MRQAALRAVFVRAKRAIVPAIFLLGSTSTRIQCSLIYFCVRKDKKASTREKFTKSLGFPAFCVMCEKAPKDQRTRGCLNGICCRRRYFSLEERLCGGPPLLPLGLRKSTQSNSQESGLCHHWQTYGLTQTRGAGTVP